MTRAEQLEKEIKGYQDSYYNGEAEISDAEFDALWDELKRIKPDSPLLAKIGADGVSDVDGFPKERHLIPMGSQEKAANDDEFLAWAGKLMLPCYVVQYKLDGASLELQYQNGELVRAVTRGDGTIGGEITSNALRMNGVIAKLKSGFSGGVRGEVVMMHDVWKAKHQNKANCRNAANGIMRRKDGEGCEDLTIIVYDATATDSDDFFTDEIVKIAWLKEQGFNTVETKELKNENDVIAYRIETAEKRNSLPFDIDGLVVKDKVTDMNDLRRARPQRQIAFKFELEQAVSVLREVEWSESGATYTPIGIVDPVRISGTKVKRANLCNPDLIRNMGLKIGSKVIIVKRGEIIPKIERLADNTAENLTEIVQPTKCSSCGTDLVDEGTRLFCPNSNCPKRILHRIYKWVSVLDIREAGEKVIKQLFDKGRVRHITDLYTIEISELSEYERMGDLSATKIIRNIHTPRLLSLAVFVAAFDIDGVGESIMEKITESGFGTLEKLRAADIEQLAEVYGVAEITAKTIVEGLKETAADMDDVLALGFVSIKAPAALSELPLKGLSFCFTGELNSMKRAEAGIKIRELGGSVKASVVKELNYLVTNDIESGSAKNKKARELGVSIINEEEFLNILAGTSKKE